MPLRSLADSGLLDGEMNEAMAIETVRIEANGVEFVALSCGEGPLVLCLHGFPDTAYGFKTLLGQLAGAGFRAVAPFLRGYAPTGPAADGDYRFDRLAADALALIEALGAEQADLVGHDWGALAAMMAAHLDPVRVRRVVIAAVPHPRVLEHSLRGGGLRHLAGQLRRSWYMLFFQLPWLPERVVRRRDFAFIDRIWRAWSPGWDYREQDIAPVKAALADPAALRAALAYYRDTIRSAGNRDMYALAMGAVVAPALVVCGEDDGCMGAALFESYREGFDGEVTLVRMAGAGHFMHREQPEAFFEAVVAFLGG